MSFPRPFITDIKRHSLEDGPGIRSVVFFKGCPLSCVFCHNPETQQTTREIAFHAQSCMNCAQCASVCALKAIDLSSSQRIQRDKCNCCGKCAHLCPTSALRTVGTSYSLDELVEILMLDEPFYRYSGGGVTLSGGEPTLFPKFLEELIARLKDQQIHIVLETSGEFDIDWFCARIFPQVDLVYFDLKLADPDLHQTYIGQNNSRILENCDQLLKLARNRIVPRIPLVPGITATHSNLEALVAFLHEHHAQQAILLPYNPLGHEKAVQFGYDAPPIPTGFMPRIEEQALYGYVEELVQKKY